MDADRSDARLLELASSIVSGAPVDWSEEEQLAPDKQEAELVRSLHVVDQIAQVHRSEASEGETRPVESADQNRNIPPQQWRHLTILENVGQGAFGDVYRARDAELDWQVALKLLLVSEGPGSPKLSHLLNEARLLAKVRHPNVVSVYGAEHAENRVGLWMEFIKGRTLEELLSSHVTFGDKEAAQIGQQLCRALAAVHGVGLVHRDIKARNVMREEGGRIVLMDFGAGADLREANRGSVDTLAGTPLYLAPEMFEGGPPSVSADIYSLGVLLFHLVTGSYPVEGQTRADVQRAHHAHERKYLRDVRPDLPEAFIRVVERAIEFEPKKRYRTAGEFEAALASLSGPAQDSFDKVSPLTRWRGALVAAALLIAVAAGATWWSMNGKFSNAATTERTDATQPSAAPPALTATASNNEYLAAFHTMRDGQSIRLRQGARVVPGDRLFLDFEASRPAYVYVVNQDEHGEGYLLFPLPGRNPSNPLPSGQSHRLPGGRSGEELYWQVSTAGGREHFYIFASAERPVAFENLLATLPAPEVGRPVVNMPLPKNALGVLRSVGGLTSGEPAHPTGGFQPRFPPLPELPDRREAVNGLWEREITFENPGK